MKNTKKRNLKRLSQRCFAVLLAVLMLFSCLSAGVSALSIGETVKVSGVKDWIGGYYYSFQGSDFGTHNTVSMPLQTHPLKTRSRNSP